MRTFSSLTWPELAGRLPLVAVPVGSTEQHGPHLPVDTDTRIARAVAEGLAERIPRLLVAPPLPYGASGEHAGFPGTLSLGTDALRLALIELVRSADDSACGVVLVNGHGGNAAALRSAAATLTEEGRRVLVWAPRAALAAQVGIPRPEQDLHAGRAETSLLLHLAPELVRLAEAAPGPAPALADLVRRGVRAHSPTGVLGDPAGASAAEGAALLALYVTDATQKVESWAAANGLDLH